MPWELAVIKYDGQPPRLQKDASESRKRPLGSLDKVRQHISESLPGVEWHEEPPLIDMMKASGSKLWEDWDAEMIAHASQPTLTAVYRSGGVILEIYGFKENDPVGSILVDVRGDGNPIPALKAICEPKGWTIVEMGEDGEFLDLSGPATARWNAWQQYLNAAIEHVRTSDDAARSEEPTPCPHCGKPLRTAKAQQCFECGADWHGTQTET